CRPAQGRPRRQECAARISCEGSSAHPALCSRERRPAASAWPWRAEDQPAVQSNPMAKRNCGKAFGLAKKSDATPAFSAGVDRNSPLDDIRFGKPLQEIALVEHVEELSRRFAFGADANA